MNNAHTLPHFVGLLSFLFKFTNELSIIFLVLGLK